MADAACFKLGDVVTFVNWGNMRVVEVRMSKITGEVDSIDVDLDLENTVGFAHFYEFYSTFILVLFRTTRKP